MDIRHPREISSGLLVCCAVSLCLVFVFRAEVHVTTVMVLGFIRDGMKPMFIGWYQQFIRWLDGPQSSLVKILAALLMIAVGLAGALLMLPLVVVAIIVDLLGIGGYVDALFLFGFDIVLGLALGAFTYGIVLPAVWMILEPLLALTLAELVYQRLRARMTGVRPRYRQPLYLMAGLFCLAFGAVRLAFPVVGAVQAEWQAAARDLYPPTPTPNPWPKRFTVAPNQTVKTGIVVNDQNLEFFVHPSKHVFVRLDKTSEAFKGSGEFLIRGRRPESNAEMFAGWTGEVVLRGADEQATVVIFEPQYHGRRWLQAGETFRTGTWIAEDEKFAYCGGWYLSYRTTSKAGSSAWRDLPKMGSRDWFEFYCKDSWEAPRRPGIIEFKALYRTWVADSGTVKPYRDAKLVDVPAQRVVSSGVTVRPGDQVRVTAIDEPVYYVVPRAEDQLIPRGRYSDVTVNYTGAVQVKGGVVDSRATVLLVARGPNWK